MSLKKILIGREDSNSVVIAETSVSRVHAELIDSSKKLYLKDLESKNSTFIIREGIHILVGSDPVELRATDQVCFGLTGPYKLAQLTPAFQTQVILLAREKPVEEKRESKTSTAVMRPTKYRCPSCGSIVKNTSKLCEHCQTHL